MFDIIIIGGSYAGLSAGLQVARARQRVLVVDGGQRRNRFATTSHGFLGQDGRAPGDIVAEARTQLIAYSTVEWVDGYAETAEKTGLGFSIRMAEGQSFDGRRLLLAVGVADELPDIPGLSERWGRGVFPCPYCDGYELDQGHVGVLAVSPMSMHQAMLLPDWGRTTFFLNGTFEPDKEQMAQLTRRGVTVERERVIGISGGADVELADGRVVPLAGLFTGTHIRPASPLAEQLGCALEQTPLGSFIKTDAFKETTVPGVFACGDAARGHGSVAIAVGDGAFAGSAVHRSLIFTDA